MYPDFKVHKRSIGLGLLEAHVNDTFKRVVEESGTAKSNLPRLTNYNYDWALTDLTKKIIIGGYLVGGGYLLAQYGLKGLFLWSIPLVTNGVSHIYERYKEAKQLPFSEKDISDKKFCKSSPN